MKKKIILICFIFLLCICGCNNKTKNIEENIPKEIKKIGDNIKTEIKCEEIKDIVDFSFYENLFITNDGKLYQISFDKIFTNEKNCKQIESNHSFIKFIRGGILDQNNNFYYFDRENYELKSFNFENGYTLMPYLSEIDKSIYSSISSTMKPNNNMPIYFYTNNNNVYLYEEDGSFTKHLNSNPILSLDSDEKILYFIDGTIKTNKKYYSYKSKLKNEECKKYADIKCIYEDNFYSDNEEINNQYDNIKYYKEDSESSIIIDINNNIYTNIIGG